MRVRARIGAVVRTALRAAAIAAGAGTTLVLGPATAGAEGYIHEFPHPDAVVQFHPRGDQAFRLEHLVRALGLGASGAELDLQWRAADSTVVCGHDRRGLEARPTLEQALQSIFAFQGPRASVRGDGRQFFVVLDLKDERPAFHRGLIGILAAQGARFSNSASPSSGPRGITVVITGFRAALERSIPAAVLDSLCVIEGRDYGARIRNVGMGRFQWLALDYPIDRTRVRDIHEGRDGRARGSFHVRVVAAGKHVARAIEAGADAVNADLDQIEEAVRAAARVSSEKNRRR